MEIKNKLKKLLHEFCNGIIGLESNQSFKNLSEKELYDFYRDLGYQPLGMALFFAVLLWFTTTTIGNCAFDTLLATSFGCVVCFFLLKICWPKWKIDIKREEEDVDCEFNKVGFKGFLTYDGKDYLVEDYVLKNNELFELNLELGNDEQGGKEARIFYSVDEQKFIKVTEKVCVNGLRLSYKIVSWSFFAVCIIATFVMIVGALAIVL